MSAAVHAAGRAAILGKHEINDLQSGSREVHAFFIGIFTVRYACAQHVHIVFVFAGCGLRTTADNYCCTLLRESVSYCCSRLGADLHTTLHGAHIPTPKHPFPASVAACQRVALLSTND